MKLCAVIALSFAAGVGSNLMTDTTEDVKAKTWQIEALRKQRQENGGPWLEFLKVPALSTGIYELKAGATDGQQPHDRDEIYYVLKGKATFEGDGKDTAVKPGSVIYVKREVDHRFKAITEDLSLLVFFATGPDE